MFGFKQYNFDHFRKEVVLKDILLERLKGPAPGDRAPDFAGRTLDGDEVSLRELRGDRNLVLTFGSATCPFTVFSLRGLNRLYRDYAGQEVEFLLVYVREAHPGERLPAHRSLRHKQYAARWLRDEENLEIPVLVDDLKGTIHRKYGTLPNATYLIDKSGRVAFRSLWSRADMVKQALDELLERQRERDVEHAVVAGGEDTAMPTFSAAFYTHRALERGGPSAFRDFEQEMGVSGRLAVGLSRWAGPMAESPVRAATMAGMTVGVVVGGLLLGRYLRRQRRRPRLPYDIEDRILRHHRPAGPEGYEAVGI